MRNGDDGAADAQGLGQPVEVFDALGQAPNLTDPLGPAHPELVDGYDPPTGRGVGDESAPQVGPGRVAVNAQHGPDGTGFWSAVEHVEPSGHPVGIDNIDQPGPTGVQPGQAG